MLESNDLYSLSNSTADESSNKSDSQGFDSNLCAYQDYDRSSELDLINNFKYSEDPEKSRPHKDAKGDLEYKKKSTEINPSSATVSEPGLSVQRQMNISKSKGLFNIFSNNVDPEVLYRPPELPMKVPTSSYYKTKRFHPFKDEFTLNLSRQSSLSMPDKNGNENPKLDGFSYSNRIIKEVNLQRDQDKIDPMAEHVLASEKMAFERLRGGGLLQENPPGESTEMRHLNGQSTSRIPSRFETLNFERIKHGSFIAKDEGSRSTMTREAFMTHLQQTHPQQQHQQQQTKSFTIDAILGLRNNQRDKHRAQQFRKGQDESQGKHSSAGSCSGNGNGGKLKRVRTIFTAEQLERLEGEFSRQQYMVGPERLYLAHALRLTEAQVKVWFQNRRIKWRKLNHEQQSQRLHELHQRSLSSLEHEDSNENGEW